jgi:hypothetical protein
MSDDDAQRSRWQDLWDKTLPVIAGGFIAGVFAIAGSYYATKFQMVAQSQTQKAEEQRKVFASLVGRKLVAEQLNVSRAEARLFSDYNEERWKRAGAPKDSLDLDETKRWMHRSEDLVFEIMKSNQALFEDIATVRALFPDTPRLRELCARVYAFRTLQTPAPPHFQVGVTEFESLAEWKDEADRKIQSLGESEYGKPIDELTAYLLTQLRQ